MTVHGLDGASAAPDWRPIDASDLRELSRGLARLKGARILWPSPRPFSAGALVESQAGRFFVKRHDPRVRDVSALHEEHAFAAHLARGGARIVEPLRGEAGESAFATRTGVFEVFGDAPGEDLYREAHSWTPVRNEEHARALGEALARFHLAAAGFDAPVRPPRPLLCGMEFSLGRNPGEALLVFCADRPAVADFLAREDLWAGVVAALSPWHERWRALGLEPEPLWVHGDWHASNLFWQADGAGVASVIDLGLCNRACALLDLAIALERNSIEWLREGGAIGRPELALAILRGYEAVKPLDVARRNALVALLPISHVETALSEVDYFFGVLGDRGRARLACPGFLVGHVEWFGAREGRDYLEALTPGPSPGGRGEDQGPLSLRERGGGEGA